MDIRHVVNENGHFEFKTSTIDLLTVKEFGIVVRNEYKRNGDFKKFLKTGYIRLINGEVINRIGDLSFIGELKLQFKGNLTSKKEEYCQFKKTKYGYSERKAIGWTYIKDR